eukprot:CAMPEP_0115038392 /NCGR_PEP_ID=MMETSP0216-20121206/43383_1 /TAXON_ID=223996 /ORGANISM="Protocruzia adherens, Strain Boccale" /LENGTH=123 /DNA_ID=CAMNT_0002418787 /DNA_START=152 /DNA_END=520 /DNA_ORIENTATION=+
MRRRSGAIIAEDENDYLKQAETQQTSMEMMYSQYEDKLSMCENVEQALGILDKIDTLEQHNQRRRSHTARVNEIATEDLERQREMEEEEREFEEQYEEPVRRVSTKGDIEPMKGNPERMGIKL